MNNANHSPGYVPNPDYTQEDWDEVCDNPEWTEEDFKNAVPFKDAFPDLYASWLRQRGLDDTAATERVTLTLDRTILDRFRATGPGWEARMHGALRHAADALTQKLPAA